ncbi:diaminobutyrate acetyltransferase [Rhodococcus xishaensis]|uniref:L-2,4-diaminobutyric acid acetyltransferase n=1 Tax=Rhodococcus xishaensis TaxID=2487364 RepID=A0A438ANH8_9NOCA|nr:diaminobutyrate acetyltransferase [Rhodococcus xishaensis]
MRRRGPQVTTAPTTRLRAPEISDGARIWEIAGRSGELDLNSSYSYLMWCRDHWETSIVAELDGRTVGFVTGYIRPTAPLTLFVWQVAVDAEYRGRGIGLAMLGGLVDRLRGRSINMLETTITRDNAGSIAMFSALARSRGADIGRRPLFESEDFPDGHAAEELYTIGPFPRIGLS